MTCPCGQEMEPIPEVGFLCFGDGCRPDLVATVRLYLYQSGRLHADGGGLGVFALQSVLIRTLALIGPMVDQARATLQARHQWS